MQFNQQDIEDVAKSRVNRAEKKSTDKWFIGMAVGVIAGFIVAYSVNLWGGAVLCIASVIAFLWYNSKLSKKQNDYKSQLIKQWRDENTQKGN